MPLLFHGIDAIEVARIARSIDEHGERFLARVFTAGERATCDARKNRVESYAARFAAKEAVLKALGTGWRDGIAWTDVEVVLLPSGQPTVRLHAGAEKAALERGIASWTLSLSHTKTTALASAIGMRE